MNNEFEILAVLKAARLAKGWTLKHTGNRLGVDHSTIAQWESSRRAISLTYLFEYASLLGIDIHLNVENVLRRNDIGQELKKMEHNGELEWLKWN